MKPEDLIGPAAAKALAEHFTLTPIAKPLPPEVVTMEETGDVYMNRFPCGLPTWYNLPRQAQETYREALSGFVLHWLRARIDQNLSEPGQTYGRKSVWRLLTGREWTP